MKKCEAGPSGIEAESRHVLARSAVELRSNVGTGIHSTDCLDTVIITQVLT